MGFIKDIFKLLKETTWPTRKESWRDFRSIMEYTAFFVVIIYIFDQLIVSGLIRFINIFLEERRRTSASFFYYERKYHG